MRKLSRKRGLLVCYLSQSCLAEAYLRDTLQRDPLICAVSYAQYERLSPRLRRRAVFVLDEHGLGGSLRESIRRLQASSLDPRFLVLDHGKSQDQIVEVLASGAHGYIPHGEVATKVISAIWSVAANNYWVAPEILHRFLCEVGKAINAGRRLPLVTTPREDEILELVRRRLSNREIADALHIRISTVKFHLSNILSKFHVHSRLALGERSGPQPCRR